MSSSLVERVSALEQTVTQQSALIARLAVMADLLAFVPPSQAAKILNISESTIRNRIKHSKAFPKESRYKEGIHWKQTETTQRVDGKEPGYRYLINTVEWAKV